MNSFHRIILDKLEKAPKKISDHFDVQGYIGSTHKYIGITNNNQRLVAKAFYNEYPDLTFSEFISLLDSLNNGATFSEKTIGPMLISFYKNHLSSITPNHISGWLENLEGWAEIDSLCQSTFHAETLLTNWESWDKALDKFSTDKNINKRRSSLVLLCKSIRESSDSRLKIRALQNVERLKHEKPVLITKAISWILREMTKQFKKDVSEYLEKNADSLPKIAVRETRKKILTGKK